MKKFKFEDLKLSSIYITPNFPATTTRRYKFRFFEAFWYVIIYSVFVSILVSLIFILTPAKNLLFIIENKKLSEQTDKIAQMEERLYLLTEKLNSLTSKNSKLQYAVLLATTDSVDSNSYLYDSLQTETNIIEPDGNLLKPLKILFERFFNKDSLEQKIFFIEPVDGYIVRDFLPNEGHMGIDYGVKSGTTVYSISSGTVLFAGFTAEDGNLLILKHNDDYISIYKHCSVLMVNTRDIIAQGEVIALSGKAGLKSTGPHLHLEIWYKGKPIDPQKVLLNNRRLSKNVEE